jgi:hypothetical protein
MVTGARPGSRRWFGIVKNIIPDTSTPAREVVSGSGRIDGFKGSDEYFELREALNY